MGHISQDYSEEGYHAIHMCGPGSVKMHCEHTSIDMLGKSLKENK